VLFTLAGVLHISIVIAHGGNVTEREKPHGSQETHQAFEKGKEARTDQTVGTAADGIPEVSHALGFCRTPNCDENG
jgi:hypothetical protein